MSLYAEPRKIRLAILSGPCRSSRLNAVNKIYEQRQKPTDELPDPFYCTGTTESDFPDSATF